MAERWTNEHRKCQECGERRHVYMFPLTKETGLRGPVCLPCVTDRQTAERLARLARR